MFYMERIRHFLPGGLKLSNVDYTLYPCSDARAEVGVVLPVQRPLSLHLDTTYYPTRYSEVRGRGQQGEGPTTQFNGALYICVL